jgi:hypothetical protein
MKLSPAIPATAHHGADAAAQVTTPTARNNTMASMTGPPVGWAPENAAATPASAPISAARGSWTRLRRTNLSGRLGAGSRSVRGTSALAPSPPGVTNVDVCAAMEGIVPIPLMNGGRDRIVSAISRCIYHCQ